VKTVRMISYDPRWPELFERASAEVATALGENLVEIHHIGSTSIPGIYAKPIVDMLAVVKDLSEVDARSTEMRALGYEVMGEFGIEGRRYFRRNDSSGERTEQVHTFAEGSPHVRRHLAFRDFLRAHPKVAQQYSDLKRTLAAAHADDVEAYMDGKDAFIKETEARALEWKGDSCG